MRYIKQHEDSMRQDSLARKLAERENLAFWKEIKNMNNSRTPLPTNINGVVGEEQIADLWKDHYENLFNSVKSDIGQVQFSVLYEDSIEVTCSEIQRAIHRLKGRRS